MDRQSWTLLGSVGAGAGLGAGLMYLLDPQAGRRRRTVARDKAKSALKQSGDAVKRVSHHLGNRTKGLVAAASSRLRRNEDVDDQVLRDRVRSKLGHAISHPSVLEVTVENGRVTLAGPVLALEADRLLDAVRSVPVVRDVECRFDLHEEAEGHPAFQSASSTAPELEKRRWVPVTARALAGTVGSALAVTALKKKAPLGIPLRTAGLGLFPARPPKAEPRRLAGRLHHACRAYS